MPPSPYFLMFAAFAALFDGKHGRVYTGYFLHFDSQPGDVPVTADRLGVEIQDSFFNVSIHPPFVTPDTMQLALEILNSSQTSEIRARFSCHHESPRCELVSLMIRVFYNTSRGEARPTAEAMDRRFGPVLERIMSDVWLDVSPKEIIEGAWAGVRKRISLPIDGFEDFDTQPIECAFGWRDEMPGRRGCYESKAGFWLLKVDVGHWNDDQPEDLMGFFNATPAKIAERTSFLSLPNTAAYVLRKDFDFAQRAG
jgi:hypothetical protein